MKLRKLTFSEVEFIVTIEPEDSSPADQFDDPEAVSHIEHQLLSGSPFAWCVVVVQASWNGFQVVNTLGACSFANQEDMLKEVEAVGMKQEALNTLQANIEGVFETLCSLLLPDENWK